LTVLQRLAVLGDVPGGAGLVVRPMLADMPGQVMPARTLALVWRPRSPCTAEFRCLALAIPAGVQ
jgi:hypothetical protein